MSLMSNNQLRKFLKYNRRRSFCRWHFAFESQNTEFNFFLICFGIKWVFFFHHKFFLIFLSLTLNFFYSHFAHHQMCPLFNYSCTILMVMPWRESHFFLVLLNFICITALLASFRLAGLFFFIATMKINKLHLINSDGFSTLMKIN